MPLSHAVIKSALARNAKQKRKSEGGLTAKNKAMAIPERRTDLNSKVPSNIITGMATSNRTKPEQKTKRAAPSNPSGSERTKKSKGVNFVIAKKKRAKSNQLPKYRS
jgi:hypothetical protein|tara:strand:+ start:394 stop:714 length:321 start_codon:yes stop_codon:yes gene_type:complete